MQKARSSAFRLVALQFLVVLLVALAWLFKNVEAGFSAVMGGLSTTLPNFYFVHRFFGTKTVKTPSQILLSLYMGELLKLVVSVALLMILLHFLHLNLLPLLSGFIAAYLGFWLASPVLLMKKIGAKTL